jgi:hypothetical protein
VQPTNASNRICGAFDRVVVTAWRSDSSLPSRVPPAHRRTRSGIPDDSTYKRFQEFVSADASDPRLILLSRPHNPFAPAFSIVLLAQGRLLEPADIDRMMSAMGLRRRVRVSEIELTMDLPQCELEIIKREFVPTWVRSAHDVSVRSAVRPAHDPCATRYWGTRKGSRQYRAYLKDLGDRRVARLECVLRRAALRNLRVDTVADLYDTQWLTRVSRAFRFVALDPAWEGPTDPEVWRGPALLRRFQKNVDWHGVLEALRKCARKFRLDFRRHLLRSPIEAILREALDDTARQWATQSPIRRPLVPASPRNPRRPDRFSPSCECDDLAAPAPT